MGVCLSEQIFRFDLEGLHRVNTSSKARRGSF